MATPTIRASGYNFATAGGTTNSITLSSSIAVGDRLYLMASAPYALTSGTDTALVAAGWFRESNFPDTNWSAGSVYSKVAVSGDIGSTITVTHTSSVPTSNPAILAYYAIAGIHASAIITFSSMNASQSVAPNPSVLGWGSANSLVLWMAALRDGASTPTITRGTSDALVRSSGTAVALAHEVPSTSGVMTNVISSGTSGNGYLASFIEITDGTYVRTDYESAVLADSPFLFWTLRDGPQDYSNHNRAGFPIGTWNFQQSQSVSTFLGNGSKAGTAGTSYITSQSIAWPAGVITIEMWVDIVLDSTMFWGFTSWDSWGVSPEIRFNNGSGNPAFAAGYPTSGLHHLVWVFQQGVSTSTLGKLYVDGVLYLNAGGITPPTLGTQSVHLSGWNNDAGYRYSLNRFASNFAIYNTELTQAKVTAHYLSAFSPMVSNLFGDTRTTITGAVAKTVDTSAFTTEASEPLGNGPALNTAWATFVPTTSAVYQIDTIGSSYDTALAIYTGSSLGSLTLMVADDSSGGSGNAKTTVFLVAGTTYYIQCGGAGGATGGTLILNISVSSVVVSDNFLGGPLISLGTVGTTASNPTPNTLTSNPDAETVIAGCDLTVTPAATVPLTYDLQGSQNAGGQNKQVTWRVRRDNLAGAVIVNSGSKGATIDSSAGNDSGFAFSGSFTDSSPTTGHYVLTSEGTGTAVTTTYIARSVFTVTGAGPSTSTFTTETGEPLTMPVAKTGWVRFQPVQGGYYQFDTIGSSFDTGLAVYTGTALTALTLVGSDNDSGGSGTSKLVAHLTAGVIYSVQIGSGSGTAAGTLSLTVTATGFDAALVDPLFFAVAQVVPGVGLTKGRSTAANDALPGA